MINVIAIVIYSHTVSQDHWLHRIDKKLLRDTLHATISLHSIVNRYKATLSTILLTVLTLLITISYINLRRFMFQLCVVSLAAIPLTTTTSKDLSGSEFLSVFIGDINKKEAPRISDSKPKENPKHHVPVSRNSRSNKDDLQTASSSYYNENIADEQSIESDFADTPKILGVRVTSSVAVARGKPAPINQDDTVNTPRKIKSPGYLNRFADDSPTTWRPSHFRLPHKDFYRGVSSNRHTVTTLPGSLLGANEDYIEQQRTREATAKKPDPYQTSIIYHNHHKESQRPRSFSYSSVVNSYDPWSSSTRAETTATEATASYVTIIDHQPTLDSPKEPSKLDQLIERTRLVENSENIEKSHLPTVYSEPAKIYSEPAKVYSEPAKVYGKQEQIYSEPAKVYSEPAKVYSEPAKVYSEPAKVYSEPAKIYSEPAKIYSEPSKVYSQPAMVYHSLPGLNLNDQTQQNSPHELTPSNNNENYAAGVSELQKNNSKGNGNVEQNYEVDESVSVMTNGRAHGVQEKQQDDNGKVGYVVEGRNYRKYRVEERTSDGFIVGEYGVVSNNDGSLRGVRYTADGTTNPRLIYDALMKFLSL